MTDSEIEELRAQVQGLRIALSMALHQLPDQTVVAERLRALEEEARQQNMHAGTVEVLHSFREAWNEASSSIADGSASDAPLA